MISRLRIAALLSLSALLAGCGVGARAPASDLYVLKANLVPLEQCHARAVVQVATPEAASGLEGSRIAVFDTPVHLNYYTGASWAAGVPRMVQGFMVDAFTETQAFKSVSTGLDGVHPDVTVLTSIRGFEVRGIKSPVVHVAILARIVNSNTGALLKTVPFETTVTPEKNHMPSIVDAFNQAMNDAAGRITEAVAETVPGCKRRERESDDE